MKNVESLLLMFVNQEKEEFMQFKGLLAEAQKKLQEQNAEQAVEQLQFLLRRLHSRKDDFRREIRVAKSEIRRNTKYLDRLDKDLAFAQETGNFFPIARDLSLTTGCDASALGISPEEYKSYVSGPSTDEKK